MNKNEKPNAQKQRRRSRNPWTNKFVQMTEFLVSDYKDKVQVISEFELFKKPMRIDVVIIKLEAGVVIDNTVMRFFRAHNIVEFKSPKDVPTIEEFDKIMSYFYAYLSNEYAKHTPPLSFDDVAITLVSVNKPEKMLNVLRGQRKYKIVNTDTSGIYYIIGKGQTPAMQLVVSSELPRDGKDQSLLWLRSLRDSLTVDEAKKILECAENLNDDNSIMDIVHFIFDVNPEVVKEVEKMPSLAARKKKALREWAIVSGAAEEWKREAARETAQKLLGFLREGHSVEEAEKMFAYT